MERNFKKVVYLAGPCSTFSTWDLELQRVGSSSLTRDPTPAPCTGITES